jgi:hypothetical protein
MDWKKKSENRSVVSEDRYYHAPVRKSTCIFWGCTHADGLHRIKASETIVLRLRSPHPFMASCSVYMKCGCPIDATCLCRKQKKKKKNYAPPERSIYLAKRVTFEWKCSQTFMLPPIAKRACLSAMNISPQAVSAWFDWWNTSMTVLAIYMNETKYKGKAV